VIASESSPFKWFTKVYEISNISKLTLNHLVAG